MANNEIFFAQHPVRLTDIKVSADNYDEVISLLKNY